MSDHPDIIEGVGLHGAAHARMVGRDAELARLAELLGISGDAGSGLVLLAGDAGIGKTRLLTETAALAREAGWRVLVGHCLGEAGRSLPYLPFSEMLGRLEVADPSVIERILMAQPHVAGLFPGRRRPTDPRDLRVLDNVDRADLVAATQAAFEELAAEQPLLVVVEDVHWADESSRDLLTLLFTRGFAGRVSVVASYRSDDLHRRHPLRETLAHWSRLADLRRVELDPLTDDAVRELVSATGPTPLTDRQVETVVARAEGNAFFAEELVAASTMVRSGAAADLSRLLLVRFDQLSSVGQHVVRVASAAGRHVSHVLLAGAAGLSDAELDEGLRDAVEHHILVPTESGGYAFRHALLAETVYDDLLPGERVRVHARYAAVLTSDPTLGGWADVARHASAAGDTALALSASVHAGDDALSVGGPQEAWQHYQRALALISDADPDADQVVLRAAAASTARGQALKGVELIVDRLARRSPDADIAGEAELLAALATTARLTESPIDTLELTRSGLDLLERGPGDHPEAKARLLAARVQVLADRGRDREALEAVDEAVTAAEGAGLPDLANEVRVVAARILERAGDPDASRATLERIIAQTRSVGDVARVRAFHHLGSLHHRSGRLNHAVDVYLAGAEAGRSAGRMWAPYAFDCRLLAAIAAYEGGRWDDARRILDVGGQTPPQPAAALLLGAGLYVTAGRGDDGWRDQLAAIRPWWDADGLAAVLAGSAAIDLHGQAGDLEAVIAAHDEVVTELSRIWQPHFQAQLRISALFLGQLAAQVQKVPSASRAGLLSRGRGATEAGEQSWELAAPRGHGGLESTAWVARLRAEDLRLRWLGGEPVDGVELVRLWGDAVAAFDAYGHRYEAARSRVRQAAALQAVGDPGAGAILREALGVARELGSEPLTAEIRAVGGLPASSARPAHRHGEALTAREREILALVALGRSNRQIGTQLFISAKTASVHVSNILAKLGVSGRGEAVAVARDQGLLD